MLSGFRRCLLLVKKKYIYIYVYIYIYSFWALVPLTVQSCSLVCFWWCEVLGKPILLYSAFTCTCSFQMNHHNHTAHRPLRWVQGEGSYSVGSKVNMLSLEELERDMYRLQCFILSQWLESKPNQQGPLIAFRSEYSVVPCWLRLQERHGGLPQSTYNYSFK